MFEQITKDGVYELRLTDRNPYCQYLVVKTYGDVQKKRAMSSLQDLKQQIEELDENYAKSHPDFRNRGFKRLISKKEKSREQVNYYQVYDDTGKLCLQGSGKQIAETIGCNPKTVCNVANSSTRRLTGSLYGKRTMLRVCKADHPRQAVL